MWVRTVSGWRFFKIEYTIQGIPYPTEETEGKVNFKNITEHWKDRTIKIIKENER